MPVSYRIDVVNRVVWSDGWGVVTAEEMAAHSKRLREDPRFEPDFRQLQVLLDAGKLHVTPEDLRYVASVTPWGAGSRRAVVVASDVVFGLARQHELLREDPADELKVFRDMAAALAWLGLPLDWQPPPPSPADPLFLIPPPSEKP